MWIIPFKLILEFEPRDLWIGLYWDEKGYTETQYRRDFYLCLLPMFPLHFIQVVNGDHSKSRRLLEGK